MDRASDTSSGRREPVLPSIAHSSVEDDMSGSGIRTGATAAALFGLMLCAAGAHAQATDRPTVAIIDFEATPGGWTIPPPRVGEMVAQLLLDRLVSTDRFRVLDGQWLRTGAAADAHAPHDALLANARDAGVDYVVYGSITQFSMEQRQRSFGGGGLFRRAPVIGGYGRQTSNLAVSLLARLVNVRTGEVVATATGDGVGSRSQLSAGTLLSHVPLAGGLASRASNSRDAQLNEATRRAVDAATQSLMNSAHRLFTQQ
jgi:curli biogenesis system outer membrane secretion channel CsgG